MSTYVHMYVHFLVLACPISKKYLNFVSIASADFALTLVMEERERERDKDQQQQHWSAKSTAGVQWYR